MHELADRYDCPPLKLSAWRLLQQTVPGYDVAPDLAKDVSFKGYVAMSTGFGGPGENPYVDNGEEEEEKGWNSDDEEIPSLFQPGQGAADDEADGDDDDEGQDEDGAEEKRSMAESKEPTKPVKLPSELPRDAPAADVVRAWAARLNAVYELCLPPGWKEEMAEKEQAAEENEGEGDGDDEAEQVTKEEGEVEQETPRKDKSRLGRSGGGGSRAGGSPLRPLNSPADKMSPFARSNGRKFQRGNNSTYDWKGELERIYTSIKMPEKIEEIPKILKMFKGKEEQMLGSLLTKYKKQMSPDLYEYLDNLHNALDTASVDAGK